MDDLCNILNNSNIEYDERKELEDDTYEDLSVTIERYNRYIAHIDIWELDSICYVHIYRLICKFLNNNIKCESLSKQIDIELIKMINRT